MLKFKRPALLGALAASFFLLAAIGGCRSEPAPPHIFVISIDTLRADYLQPYGSARAETPAAKRLAEGGTLFTRAITPMGITIPVHATMLTGLAPRQHGLRANVHQLSESIPLITERLQSAGYATASVLSLGAMNFISGLARGFDYASDRDEDGRAFRREDPETLQLALDWLGRQDGQSPLFMLMHFYDVHEPHEPSEYSHQQLADYEGRLRDGISVETMYNDFEPLLERPDDIIAARTLYAGEVAEADQLVARFLEQLEAQNILDDSVVILVADHGQGLGENGYFGHGPTLEQTVLHVPIIVHDFRRSTKTRHIAQNVGLIDLAPTLLSLAGLPSEDLPGRNLMQIDESDEPVIYLSEVEQRSTDTAFRPENFDDQALAVYFGDYKLVDQDGELRLFRIGSEWGHDIEPVGLDGLHESMQVWLTDYMDAYRDGSMTSQQADLNDEAIEHLRSLGYIQ
ncbi:MAG: sulfatase [Wenzhouxiangellaceae bacterium]|nr:sulfatase [Wenzhouxiangellaceae bacterium]